MYASFANEFALYIYSIARQALVSVCVRVYLSVCRCFQESNSDADARQIQSPHTHTYTVQVRVANGVSPCGRAHLVLRPCARTIDGRRTSDANAAAYHHWRVYTIYARSQKDRTQSMFVFAFNRPTATLESFDNVLLCCYRGRIRWFFCSAAA